MTSVRDAAIALEEALKDLLGVFGDAPGSPEILKSLSDRCAGLTTRLVTATAACTSAELEEAEPALRRAQRLNAIAHGVVERQRDGAGTQLATVQRARRDLGSNAPVPDGTSCDISA